MKRRYRLTRTKDFDRVKSEGKVLYHPLLVLAYCERVEQQTRIAVVASKSVGNAVFRNKIKRKLRACLNTRLEKIKNGWDLVFFSRTKIVQAKYQEICEAIDHLLINANILHENA